MTIREKLINLRDENNLSQQEFAALLNVSRQTVSRWEAGKSVPSSAQITNICRVFSLDANDLLSSGGANGKVAAPDGGGKEAQKRIKDKRLIAVLAVVGALLLLAVAGLIVTIVYAVKDAAYDTVATVWIVAIPQNTPMIILSVFLAVFIILLTALLAYLLRRTKK